MDEVLSFHSHDDLYFERKKKHELEYSNNCFTFHLFYLLHVDTVVVSMWNFFIYSQKVGNV